MTEAVEPDPDREAAEHEPPAPTDTIADPKSIVIAAVKGEIGHFVAGTDESWDILAQGIIDKMAAQGYHFVRIELGR